MVMVTKVTSTYRTFCSTGKNHPFEEDQCTQNTVGVKKLTGHRANNTGAHRSNKIVRTILLFDHIDFIQKLSIFFLLTGAAAGEEQTTGKFRLMEKISPFSRPEHS